MVAVNKNILILFLGLIISSFNLSAQELELKLGEYVHQKGSHGAKEMLRFKKNNYVDFKRQILTRPTS